MASDKTRVALVTGGSAGGIGHAVAVGFAKLGYRVAITGRNEARLAEALGDLSKAAPDSSLPRTDKQFLVIRSDFGDEQQVEAVVPQVIEAFGQLDVLVNNAGFVGRARGFTEPDFFEDFKSVMQVNLFAPTRLAQLAAPHLLRSEAGGVIINVSSVADQVASKSGSYSISKAGLNMLTRTLANSFEGKNVRVLTVSPGPIVTNLVPGYRGDGTGRHSTLAGRSGTCEEVAEVILFLASQRASYMTGTTVDVDGGFVCKAGVLLSDACAKGRMEDM